MLVRESIIEVGNITPWKSAARWNCGGVRYRVSAVVRRSALASKIGGTTDNERGKVCI